MIWNRLVVKEKELRQEEGLRKVRVATLKGNARFKKKAELVSQDSF